jgi:hypothetical protein
VFEFAPSPPAVVVGGGAAIGVVHHRVENVVVVLPVVWAIESETGAVMVEAIGVDEVGVVLAEVFEVLWVEEVPPLTVGCMLIMGWTLMAGWTRIVAAAITFCRPWARPCRAWAIRPCCVTAA